MKILVLGASGMVGHMISIFLKEQGHKVVGFSRNNLDFVDSISGDAFNLEFVRGIIKEGKFNAVVNVIGVLNQEAEYNKANAAFLNGYYPHFLANETKDMDTQIVHISTDCVFSGKTGNYTEKSFRDGQTFYDRSKALGELEDNKNITLRNSIIGPDINPNGIGLLNWFMKQYGTINGYTQVMWTGVTTLQLAKIVEKVVLQHVTGLYHMVPNCNISKYKLLELFNNYLRDGKVNINPCNDFVSDKTLIRTRFDFSEIVPNYDIMISEMANWMRLHKNIYQHYDLEV